MLWFRADTAVGRAALRMVRAAQFISGEIGLKRYRPDSDLELMSLFHYLSWVPYHGRPKGSSSSRRS